MKSLKKPTAKELAVLAAEAHRSCRCDGGNTMGCGACVAERKLNALIAAGLVVRTAAMKAFTDPAYALVGKQKKVAAPKTDRDVLIEIANVIGGPTAAYSQPVAVGEWEQRAQRISAMIQKHLGVKGNK